MKLTRKLKEKIDNWIENKSAKELYDILKQYGFKEEDFTDIEGISNLDPFDKVLVRDGDNEKWHIDFFSHYEINDDYPYNCLMSSWKCCVPYIGNENLLRKK